MEEKTEQITVEAIATGEDKPWYVGPASEQVLKMAEKAALIKTIEENDVCPDCGTDCFVELELDDDRGTDLQSAVFSINDESLGTPDVIHIDANKTATITLSSGAVVILPNQDN